MAKERTPEQVEAEMDKLRQKKDEIQEKLRTLADERRKLIEAEREDKENN